MDEQYFDIFISYRRDKSADLARLTLEKLKAQGYSAFLDVDSLREGDYEEKLYNTIDHCKDFIVVLPPNGLDRCIDEEDWVRKEIKRALDKKKNIIPFMMDGFKMPAEEDLPKDISKISKKNGVSYNHEYSDESFKKLYGFLKSRSKKQKIKKATILILIGVISCVLGVFSGRALKNQKTAADDALNNTVSAEEAVEFSQENPGFVFNVLGFFKVEFSDNLDGKLKHRYYRVVSEDKNVDKTAIAESYGTEIDDYYIDVDSDGTKEIVCNTERDNKKRLYIYRLKNDKVERGFIVIDENLYMGIAYRPYTDINSFDSYYDPREQTFVIDFYDTDFFTTIPFDEKLFVWKEYVDLSK
ncbi:MAG: TIR domain-containing protein [Clostridia bacterium]|nr:TIR domain-containing protein [Clostridia bacterium]